MKITRILIKVFVVLFVLSPALANEQDTDPVFVFNRICYAQVPDIDAIQTMANELAWHPMKPEEVEEFKPVGQIPERLEGWDVQVGERLYRVGITQAKISDEMVEKFPEFENGVATSCSVILDEQAKAETFLPNMQALAVKEPIQHNIPEGPMLSTMWAGGNDEYKVFLFAKTPENGKGGLLNVLVLSKMKS